MELMGALFTGKPDGMSKNHNAFWTEFEKDNPRYKSTDNALRNIFRQIARNGVAHLLLPKAGISVNRPHDDKANRHLQLYPHRGEKRIFISCQELYKDFKKTYARLKTEIINDPSKEPHFTKFIESMHKQDALIEKYITSKNPV